MTNCFKNFVFLAATCLFATSAHAQLLRLTVADAHTRDNMSVTWSPDYDSMNEEMCDMNEVGNNTYIFDADMPEQYNWMYLEVFGSNRPLVVERGRTIEVTVTGGAAPSYAIVGTNRDASLYLKQLDVALTEGRLERELPQLRQRLAKVTPESARRFVSRITDMYETYEEMQSTGGNYQRDALFNTGSPAYDRAVSGVVVNDPVYLRYRLNEKYIRNQMTREDYGDGKDLTQYGIKFMERMRSAGITNPLVKHSLLDHLASLVLYQSQPVDASLFLKPFAEYAAGDKALLEKYNVQ